MLCHYIIIITFPRPLPFVSKHTCRKHKLAKGALLSLSMNCKNRASGYWPFVMSQSTLIALEPSHPASFWLHLSDSCPPFQGPTSDTWWRSFDWNITAVMGKSRRVQLCLCSILSKWRPSPIHLPFFGGSAVKKTKNWGNWVDFF